MARPTRTGGKTSLAKKRKASPPKRRRPGKAKHRAAPAAKPPSVVAEPGQTNNHSSELKEAREQQAATAAILKVIARSPDNVQPVFEAIAASANGLLGGYSTSVLRFIDGVTHLAAFTATSPEADEILKATFPVPSSEIPFVARLATGATVQITDTETDVNPRSARLGRARGYRSILLAPLMSAGTAIGFIGVSRREAGPFADHHVNLLQTFADQAVIAIENASLLEQVQAKTRDLQEALEQQTATAEVLSVISSSAGDLVPVFDTMLGKAMQLCSADFGVLNTYDGNAFHTAATYALPPAYDEFRRGHPLEYGPGTAPARLLQGEPVVELTDLLESEAYRNGEPNRRALVDVGGARCLVAVPLLKDERVVGNVMIFRQEKGRFSEKQVLLLQQFAAQAVIAIENTRLLRELRESTVDLSESLQFQTATSDVLRVISRSPDKLQPVLDAIVETSRELCGSDASTIFLRREREFCFAAVAGKVPENLEHMRANPMDVDQPGSLFARLIRHKRTLHYANIMDDPELSQGRVGLGGPRALLVAPLMNKGEVIGAIALRQSHLKPFTERQIQAIEVFADQAVIAISNVGLFEQVQQRTHELSQSLDDLRNAQDRLIQTEKLASLGQLTAGIAHEIKNPLNFVNNFSALSVELTDELNEVLKEAELTKKIRQEVDELTGTLKDNLSKVIQHGKRADSIVKNMLLHSRTGSGEHRPVEVNAMVEESLNLAYHGARAESPQFNVTLQREFDPAAGLVKVFPQEITRVLLNLISNGFYAVKMRNTADPDAGFEPVVKAMTRAHGDNVEIRIRDNGVGIPPDIREKIFSPFFTTKPAGEGTGLGLSMSHDIVVKQHGGTIEVMTEPGSFTEFIITLPRMLPAQAVAGGQEN